jgi:hypothetical protein
MSNQEIRNKLVSASKEFSRTERDGIRDGFQSFKDDDEIPAVKTVYTDIRQSLADLGANMAVVMTLKRMQEKAQAKGQEGMSLLEEAIGGTNNQIGVETIQYAGAAQDCGEQNATHLQTLDDQIRVARDYLDKALTALDGFREVLDEAHEVGIRQENLNDATIMGIGSYITTALDPPA